MNFGPHLERLLAVAIGPRGVAIGGKRDVEGPSGSHAHLLPLGKGKPRSMDVDAGVAALAFVDENLLLGGTLGCMLVGWDVSAGDGPARVTIEQDLEGEARAMACDDRRLAVALDDGSVHLFYLAAGREPQRIAAVRLTGCPLTAVAVDPTGLVVVGSDDGGLWGVPFASDAVARPMATRGEGAVRALVCLGDGRFAAGYGDGFIAGNAASFSAFLVGQDLLTEAQARKASGRVLTKPTLGEGVDD